MMQVKRAIFLSVVCSLTIGQAFAADWTHSIRRDKFTDAVHVLATNTTNEWSSSERFRVSFECREGKDFVFSIDAFERLGNKREKFDFVYRVDKGPTKRVRLSVFTNSNTGGLTKTDALHIANDVLGGQTMTVRAISTRKDEFDAQIDLSGSIAAIFKSAKACGMSLSR